MKAVSGFKLMSPAEVEKVVTCRAWNMTHDTLLTCPLSVSTSHALVSAPITITTVLMGLLICGVAAFLLQAASVGTRITK